MVKYSWLPYRDGEGGEWLILWNKACVLITQEDGSLVIYIIQGDVKLTGVTVSTTVFGFNSQVIRRQLLSVQIRSIRYNHCAILVNTESEKQLIIHNTDECK